MAAIRRWSAVKLIDHILAARALIKPLSAVTVQAVTDAPLGLDRPSRPQPPYLTAVLVVVQRQVLAQLCGVGRIRLEREP